MRFIFYAVFIYLAYLGLKTIIKKYSGPNKNIPVPKDSAKTRRSKINLDNIEDADYEEIKKP